MMIVLVICMAWAHAGAGGEEEALALSPPPLAAALMASTDPGYGLTAASAVRDALRAGKYPWYDAQSGKVRPVLARKPGWMKSLDDQIEKLGRRMASFFESIGRFVARLLPRRAPGLAASGDALMTVLLFMALGGLLLALARLWYRRQAWTSAGKSERAGAGQGTLLADLAGADGESNVDPWTEAIRRRAAGDLAGALVYLFVHQLLGLDQIGMIRLVPGMTGRQYVSGVKNVELRRALAATLALFEEVHYGHRRPSAAAFEAAWARALAFRRDVLGKRDER